MSENNFGMQPLDAVMTRFGLSNSDLVAASTEQLTFRVMQKGRKGRRLTLNSQKKIFQALQNVLPDENFKPTDLFNYDNPKKA